MLPIPISTDDDTILVPRLSVQQIIDLSILRHDRDRRSLVQDLKDAGCSSEDSLEKLREHRKSEGLSSIVVRSAFTVDGAFQIIRLAMGGEYPESLERLDPTRLSNLALQCLGLDLDDLGNEKTESAEGNALTSEEIGSGTPP